MLILYYMYEATAVKKILIQFMHPRSHKGKNAIMLYTSLTHHTNSN